MPQPHGHALWVKVLAAVAVVAVLLVLLAAFFPWDVLRGPLNRYVSERTGRHFEITRHLDVKLGRTTRILADGIEFANPDWAHDPMLVKAQSAEIQINLLPLLRSRIEMPLIRLHKPQLGLQIEPDGRRSWSLGLDTGDPRNNPEIGALVVDEGSMHFVASHRGADIHTEFAISDQADLPLSFKSRGTWQKEPFTAQGRTGNVLYLSAPLQNPFPMEMQAVAGRTTLKASGLVSSLATLDGANASFTLQGQNWADLYKLVGVVLPSTPRYSLSGRLSKQGEVWWVKQINGKMGNTDMSGELSFDRTGKVPLLAGKMQSRSLDFDDLAPLVGLPEQPRSAAAVPQVPGARAVPADARRARPSRDPARKVLPTASLDVPRLKAMDADVHYQAARVTHAKKLPLERMKVHVRMNEGVLQLDPLDVGIAGGSVVGRLRINGNSNPAQAEVSLDARSLELNKLLPGVKLARASFGKIHGDIDLKGRGNSVATMLGTAGGNVAMLMGRGEISNLLMEFAGIDGAEIIKFMMRGDQNVKLRCAGAAFDVNQGLMTSRALVFDTDDTVVYGNGQVSLANESLDLTLHPYPKDMSILSLRSPLKMAGSFASPKLGPDKGALAGKAGVVLALAAVNPLLGLAATIETGPGKDADCGPALREAASPYAAARIAAMSQPDVQKKAAKLGGPAGLYGP
ncbi:AsmA family protein [Ramlibacter sp. WS9]|nr:AsmA family protein [Ramlibacter sp. WS9]